MIGVQVFAVLFSLFMAYIAYINFRKKVMSNVAFLFWEAIWIGFIAIVLFPSITDPILEALNFYRLFDMLTVAGFAFLVLFSFYNFIIASRNSRKIETVVRRIAIEMGEENKEDFQAGSSNKSGQKKNQKD